MKKINLSKKNITIIILCTIATIILIGAIILLWPYIHKFKDKTFQQEFENWVSSFGAWGILLLIIIQFFQVVIFVIPAEIVEVASGILYGPIGGFAICVTGMILATIFIYSLFNVFTKSKLTKKIKDTVESEGTIDKLRKNPTKIEVIMFFALLIPGIPKDIFTYIAPYLKVPMSKFLILSIIARFPSIISSTIMGSAITDGKFNLSIVIMVISTIIAIIGIIFNKQITNMIEKHNNHNT